jgi:hypothetical protein
MHNNITLLFSDPPQKKTASSAVDLRNVSENFGVVNSEQLSEKHT